MNGNQTWIESINKRIKHHNHSVMFDSESRIKKNQKSESNLGRNKKSGKTESNRCFEQNFDWNQN
jgi:hypothetical protein